MCLCFRSCFFVQCFSQFFALLYSTTSRSAARFLFWFVVFCVIAAYSSCTHSKWFCIYIQMYRVEYHSMKVSASTCLCKEQKKRQKNKEKRINRTLPRKGKYTLHMWVRRSDTERKGGRGRVSKRSEEKWKWKRSNMLEALTHLLDAGIEREWAFWPTTVHTFWMNGFRIKVKWEDKPFCMLLTLSTLLFESQC